MGANDSPITTRSVVTDYFQSRLNNVTISNDRLFVLVRRMCHEAETRTREHQPEIGFHFVSLSNDLSTLNNIRNTHSLLFTELFNDGGITWGRIATFISFSAMLAEHILAQPLNNIPRDSVITSIVDWTTNCIDTNCQAWLESQNSWAGCLKLCDRPPQRRNSISRYGSILGTLGLITLGALYMRRT